MLVMAAATTIWWAALANAAPWFFSGRPVGTGGSVLQPNLIAASVLIATATALMKPVAARIEATFDRTRSSSVVRLPAPRLEV